MAPVALAQALRLLAEVKQAAHLGSGEQAQGALAIDLGAGGGSGQRGAVEAAQQRAAFAQVGGAVKGRDPEVGGVRVAFHLKAVVAAAEQAGRLSRQLHHVVQSVRQGDVGQDMGARAERVADGRAESRQAARVVG